MASHLAMFVLCWIVFAPARKIYPVFANFIDEWSQCDFWSIWSQISQQKKPFSDLPARGPGMYTLSCIHGKLKSMMAVIE